MREVQQIADEGLSKNGMKIWSEKIRCIMRDIKRKLKVLQEKTGLKEAIITGKAQIDGIPTVLGVCDSTFYDGKHGTGCRGKNYPCCSKGTREQLPV